MVNLAGPDLERLTPPAIEHETDDDEILQPCELDALSRVRSQPQKSVISAVERDDERREDRRFMDGEECSMRGPPGANLYVRPLPYSWTEQDVHQVFLSHA